MSLCKVECRYCSAELYTFTQLAILKNENKLIVRPEVLPASGHFFEIMHQMLRAQVALKRSNATFRREKYESGNDEVGWTINCRNCEKKVGVCHSDAVTETGYDEIRPKHVALMFPNGERKSENKWKRLLTDLETCGVPPITQKDIMRRTGRKFWSREGKRTYPTVRVDVDQTSEDTLEQLTATKMRNYQMEMLNFCLRQNSLLCLPTGSGKTLVAAGVLRAMLHINPHKVAVFVVNTNHLVEQQSFAIQSELSASKVVTLSGQMDPDQRREHLKVIGEYQYDILVCTCACLNALIEINTVRIEDLCCLVLDEAHEAKGSSPYAKLFTRTIATSVDPSTRPLIMGMTASPLDNPKSDSTGSTVKRDISRIAEKLHCHPCYPRQNDPYDNGIHRTSDIVFLVDPSQEQPEFEFKQQVDNYMREVTRATHHRLSRIAPQFSQLESLLTGGDNQEVDTNKLRGKLRKIEDELNEALNKTEFRNQKEAICYGQAVRDHMNQLLAVHEINNIIGHEIAMQQLKKVFSGIDDPSPGQEQWKKEVLHGFDKDFKTRRPLYATLFQHVRSKTKNDDVFQRHLLSEKCKRMIGMIEKHKEENGRDSRILVFVDMRRTAQKLCRCLSQISGIRTALNPQVIVGRGICGDGLLLKEQQEILNDFRRGQIRLLVTTTILEEGLDVPSCNMVIRMKAPDNLRQFIQSRGRACRASNGKFYIICRNEKEKSRQQFYLNFMQTQASVIQKMMQPGYCFDPTVEHSKKVLALKEASGRKIFQHEELETEENRYSETELNEMQDIMNQINVAGAYPEELPFLDEEESEKWKIAVRFAIFVSDDEIYERAIAFIKNIIRGTHDDVLQITEWIDKKVKIENSVSTNYFSEAMLTLKENTDEENTRRFEKNILMLFTSDIFQSDEFDIWTTVLNRPSYFPRATTLRLSLHQTSVGSLKWQRQYTQQMRLGNASSLRLERGSNRIVIIVNDKLQIEASFADLREFALVDFQESNNTEDAILILYLTFAQTPRLSEISLSDGDVRESARRVNEYIHSESRHIFSNCLTYKLEIPNPRSSTQHNLIDHRVREVLKLLESSGVTVHFTSVETVCNTRPFREDEAWLNFTRSCVHRQDPEVNYAMRCLMSTPGFVAERINNRFHQILNSMEAHEAVRAIYELTKVTSKQLFCDPVRFMIRERESANFTPEFSPPSWNHAYMKRVIITPTSLRFYEPDLVQTNRIVRQHTPDIFIRVAIRDENCENLTSLHGDLSLITNRVHDILINGIEIGPDRYVYLAASNSQIRAHSCYFIREDDDNKIAERIRNAIGDLSGIRHVPRYMSRLGLAFSTSTRTISVRRCYQETDVESGCYCFSDGVGFISVSLAKKVKERHALDQYTIPSAFQIRIGGCKGVVSVWPDEFFRKHRYQLDEPVIRDSMSKYPSESKNIEVLEYTRPLPLHLNQQIIMLLNNVGVRDDVFEALLKNKIAEMNEMFVEEEAAVKALQGTVSKDINHLQRVRFQFTSDAFFRSIMIASYRLQMKDLRERSRVRLDDDKGRVLIGVMDEEGVLEYGQVFIQISKQLHRPGVDTRVITSKIVIMKNPCIHPGDVRTFKGRDVPQLRHLVDCVVFPQKGPRPHPNELSGSDLDGDQYHCIWDPRLLPSIPIKAPMEYEERAKKNNEEEVRLSQMADYICEFIANDTLGTIDNTHKALADQQGLESDICLQLAKIHAQAVDAPKSGDWVHLPADIRSELKQYPDFMMKTDKPSYPSIRVLGTMFRECNKYATDTVNPAASERSTRPHPDKAFRVEGYENYIDDACILFKQYNQEILSVMRMYGIETEAEVWSGAIASVHPRLESEMDDVKKNVKFMLKEIVKKYKAIFHNDRQLDVDHGREEERKKASAWYYAAYSPHYGDQYSVGKEMLYFLSFPWMLNDLLAEIYSNAASVARSPHSIYSEISASVKEIFDGTIETLYETYKDHTTLARVLGDACDRVAACVLFGASQLLLFDEPRGEVRVLVATKKRGQVHLSRNTSVSKEEQLMRLERVQSECSSLFAKQSLNDKQCHLRVRLNRKLPRTWARLSADPAEVVKWIVIKKYFFKNQWLFPVFRILCTWMYTTGLVGGRVFFLPDYLVPLMFIDHCLKEEKIRPIPARQFSEAVEKFYDNPLYNDCFGAQSEWNSLYQNLMADPNDDVSEERWEGGKSGRVGRLLCTFMKQGKHLIQSSLHPELATALEMERWNDGARKEMLDLLIAEMDKASLHLSLHISASVLLTKITIEKVFFIKREAACEVIGNEDELARTLHRRSRAFVDIQSQERASQPGKIVKGTGTEAELYLLAKQIESLHMRAAERQKTGRTLRTRGAKDVTGAHNLMIEAAAGNQASIRLEPYLGYRYPQHDYKKLFVIRLHDPPAASPVDHINTECYDQFRQHFRRQLAHFQRHYSVDITGPCEIQVKFGRSYVISPPQSFVEDATHLTTEELLKALERRKTRSVDPMFDSAYHRRAPRREHGGEGFISTSFVSSVFFDEKERAFLAQKMKEASPDGDVKPRQADQIGVKVVAQTGTGVVTARYDAKLNFIGVETAPLRWIVSDVKRQCICHKDEVEGRETDIRFMLKTQMSEITELEDHALAADFVDAIGRDDKKKLYVKSSQLDVDYMEEYTIFKYTKRKMGFGVPYTLVVRKAEQYTCRLAQGQYAKPRDITEVRIVPAVEPFLDSANVENAMEALWKEAFLFSDNLKCLTQ